MRRPTWNWPTGSPLGGPPSFWTANGTVTTVAGQVSAPGTAEFFYRTRQVTTERPPALRWNDWLKLHFSPAQLADPAVSGPAADPDRDGLSNDAEYAGMTWPTVASTQSALRLETALVTSAAGRHLSLNFFFDPRAVLTLTPETSPDLRAWNGAPGAAVALPGTAPGAASFRAAATVASEPRSFFRLRWAPTR